MATEGNNLSEHNLADLPNVRDKKVGIVVAEWNGEITNGLLKGVQEVFDHIQHPSENLIIEHVPGAFELPLGATLMLEHLDVDAVICIGAVIRGETAHFDYVCQGVTHGIKDVELKYQRPVIFGVLTDDNIEQSRARSGGKHGNKGVEAAVTCIKMMDLEERLSGNWGTGFSI
ncbi:MAG: 6,7-dimethyl-8-ribityllumazine synthase [Flavobacteriales bacterium]|nr:6,7-dimethyl-8-ribityllumazine synthase [Flavobacteriales bacterium]